MTCTRTYHVEQVISASRTPEHKALWCRWSFFFSTALDFFLLFTRSKIYIYTPTYNMYIIICSTFSLKTVTSADGSNILLLLLLLPTITRFAKNVYTIYIMYNIIHNIHREIDGITRSVPMLWCGTVYIPLYNKVVVVL